MHESMADLWVLLQPFLDIHVMRLDFHSHCTNLSLLTLALLSPPSLPFIPLSAPPIPPFPCLGLSLAFRLSQIAQHSLVCKARMTRNSVPVSKNVALHPTVSKNAGAARIPTVCSRCPTPGKQLATCCSTLSLSSTSAWLTSEGSACQWPAGWCDAVASVLRGPVVVGPQQSASASRPW